MRYPYSIISLSLCFFVAATIALEFFRGANAIKDKSGSGFIPSVIELTHRNTRRYGGYLVHMGIVLMFVGWSGHPFNQTAVGDVEKGGAMQVGAYTLRVANLTSRRHAELPLGNRGSRCFEERQAAWHARAHAPLLQSHAGIQRRNRSAHGVE